MIVRQAAEADEPFIMDSWLRSFRHSWFAGPIPNSLYYKVYRPIIMAVRARPGARLLVCVDDDDPDSIYGFACIEPPGIIHYVYTKDVYRRKGVARRLLAGVREPLEYTFRTKEGHNALTGKNAIYNPYRIRDVDLEAK